MLDVDTFLITLYVMVDDFCQSQPPKRTPGPRASLSESEVLTLAVFARWSRFASERDFYRYADTKLRDAFPTLPDRSQFNRLVRSHDDLIEAFALHLVSLLTDAQKHPYQALDSSAMPIRDGMRAFACSPPQILLGSSPAFASELLPLPTNNWRRPSSL
jgi:hypothetical protein